MMDKETFVKYINKIHSYMEKEIAIDNALRALSPDFGGFGMGDIINDMIELITHNMKDTSEWLDYYIYETEFGTNECADSILDVDDATKIPFKTPEDVYDLIASGWDDDALDDALEELDKTKKLLENEREHSKTLEQIIKKSSIITNVSKSKDDSVIKSKQELDSAIERFVDKFFDEFFGDYNEK